MYEVTDEYKNLILADSTKHALHVYIDDVEIDSKYILGLTITHVLFENNEFVFGSTPQKTAELKIHKDALPETYERFYITTGIEKTSLTEIVPLGYFNKESVKESDSYTVTLSLEDDMSKFDVTYDGSELEYPKTMLEVLQDICDKCGVELGSTSFVNCDKEVSVYDNTITARTFLGYIAEQAGGFAVIGRDGKLYIKTIGENQITFKTVEEINNMTVSELNLLELYTLNSIETYELLLKYFSNYDWGDKLVISRIAYEDGILDLKAGDETGCTVWIDSNNMYIVDEEQINNIYDIWKNFSCYSFTGTSIVDPAWDVGDVLEIDGKYIIYQGTIEYKGKFKAEIESELQEKTETTSAQTTVSDSTRIKRVESTIDQVEGKITQLVEEVSDNSETISQHTQAIDSITDEITEKLALYATLDDLSEMETKIVDEDVVDLLKNYITTTELENNLSGYTTSEELDTALEAYVTSATMNTTISQTQTSILNEVSTTLEGYVTVTNLDNTLSSYSTTSEMTTAIEQTQTSILNTVSSTYTTITDTETLSETIEASLELKLNTEDLVSEINASADVITLTSNRLSITSDYFTLTESGVITATSGTIGGFTIGTSKLTSEFSGLYYYNDYDLIAIKAYIMGDYSPDAAILDLLDANSDGEYNSADLVHMKKINLGTIDNDKVVSGTIDINASNPRNVIVIKKDDTTITSLRSRRN